MHTIRGNSEMYIYMSKQQPSSGRHFYTLYRIGYVQSVQ